MFPGFTTTILTLDLDPGSYQVAAKLQLSSRDEGQPQRVRCSLDPAEEQGPASDQAELSLAAPGQPGDTGALALFVSQVLNEAGDVVLWYRAGPLGSGATVSFASIRAVESARSRPRRRRFRCPEGWASAEAGHGQRDDAALRAACAAVRADVF